MIGPDEADSFISFCFAAWVEKRNCRSRTLREKFTEAGFENVATYINSGNAIVRSRLSRKKVIADDRGLCRTAIWF